MATQRTDPKECPECHRPFAVEYDDESKDTGGNWTYCPRTPDGAAFDENIEGMKRCPGKLMLAVPFPSRSIPI